MNTDQTTRLDKIRQARDAKARPHLEQYAPVWLVEEIPTLENDALQFNVVFFHPRYGWINRRYRYDAFNDVLYHKGQTTVSEEHALALEQKKPYIEAEMINTVDSYGG